MKRTALALATIAALGAATITTKPAEARGGRNAAIGFGLALTAAHNGKRKEDDDETETDAG